jgi:PAS domain-containing protein
MFGETTRVHDHAPGIVPLRLRPAVLDTLLAQVEGGVLVLDADGRIAFANEAARRLRDDGDLVTERRDRHGGPVAWATDLATARALLTGETVRDEEVEYFGADGRRRWVRLAATPVRDAAGNVAAVVCTIADVTAAKHDAAWTPVIESLARL